MNYPIFYLICQIKVGFMRLVPFTHFLQSFHNLKCQILCFFSFPSFGIMDFRFFSVYSAQFFLYIFIKNFLFLLFFLLFLQFLSRISPFSERNEFFYKLKKKLQDSSHNFSDISLITLSQTISRVMSLNGHLSRLAVTSKLQRPT